MWVVSMALLAIGILLTISLALIRPLGYALLGIGGIGLVVSLTNMDRWNDKSKRDDTRHFN